MLRTAKLATATSSAMAMMSHAAGTTVSTIATTSTINVSNTHRLGRARKNANAFRQTTPFHC
jgi:hypothetical protein